MIKSYKKYNVLSLFNGMSTLRLAFEDNGIHIDKYYSSEIKKTAIKLTQHHYPDTIQLGNIKDWKKWDIDWEKIDFIGSGSPCKDLSIIGNKKGIYGKNSRLFFVFVEILNHVKKYNPNVLFLQENVASANIKDIKIITETLGIIPQKVDSSIITAQLRERYYWSNICTNKDLFGNIFTDFPLPVNKNILFQDILEHGYTDREKARAILESESRPYTCMDLLYRRYKEKGFGNIVFYNPKQPEFKDLYKGKHKIRILTQTELERLQGFPDGFTNILNRNQSASLLGDAWTSPLIKHFISYIQKNNKNGK